ncbi:MAG: NUDIX domain-containing protein [Aggregatilineales bacterium]
MQLGANVVIFNAAGQVLLTLREDFEIWCLPGGSVDPHESIAQAAIREVHEEVGLEVTLDALVCSYAYVNSAGEVLHVFSFRGHTDSVEITRQAEEVLEARWFEVDALPGAMVIGHRQRVIEAAQGVTGRMVFERRHNRLPHSMPRAELYAFRDATGLSRSAFYQHYFPEPAPEDILIETPGVIHPRGERV